MQNLYPDEDSLNLVADLNKLNEQIGDIALKRIQAVEARLIPDAREFVYRVGPSLITRSECELFGISSPRFAIRKYLYGPATNQVPWYKTPALAIFTLRRLKYLRQSILKTHPGIFTEGELDEHLIEEGDAIADSLYFPSDRQKGYHLLTCALTKYYGLPDERRPAVPFMQQLQIGGGMCAQACMFMALCLLEGHASAIHGVAELTAISALRDSSSSAGAFEVKGLGWSDIVST